MRIEGLDNLTPIGSGGFSQVFQADEIRYGRTVAAKVLNFLLDDAEDRERFERECRAMAQLSDHPNIVPLYSTTYTDDGYPVIIMEYFAGGTLWARARRGAGLEEILTAGVKVASALHTAHQRNVTHRDVKPQNVLMSRFGEPGLTDFGISAFDRHHADHGRPRGITVAYASPEALNGVSSARTDVYSLAATLYTVLADRRPFDRPDGRRQTPAELAQRITREDPPPLQQFGYSSAIDHAIRTVGMARSAAQRPATAAEFGAVLRSVQAREGVEQTPWIEAHDVTSDTSMSTMVDHTESQAVIQLPMTPAVSEDLDLDTEPEISRRRRIRQIAAAALVVVVIAVLALVAALRGDDTGDIVVPQPVPTAATDAFYAVPLPPTDVTISRTPNGARMEWDDPNAAPVTFEIQPWRSGGASGTPITATGNSADFDPGDDRCFTMRALGDGDRGQVSLDTQPVCLDDE